MRKGQPPFGGCPQRVEKGVNAQKCAALRAEKTARNRAEFRFLASGCRLLFFVDRIFKRYVSAIQPTLSTV